MERLEATDDLDFELLFDDEGAGACEESHDDTSTCLNVRVLRRLLASSSDPFTRQVTADVTATVAGCSENGREHLMAETFRALSTAGHKVYLCKAPGSGLPGQLCFTHTYLALQRDNNNGSVDMLLIEPTLREEFHVVRPQRWYTQLIDTLPTIFIGPPRQLAALIDFMAVRMEESFRACGMTSPPWRQKASLLARWELTLGAHASYAQLPAATFASPRHIAATASTRAAANTAVLFKPSPTAVSPAALLFTAPATLPYIAASPPAAQQPIKLPPVELDSPPAAAEHREPLISPTSPRATAAAESSSGQTPTPTTTSSRPTSQKQERDKQRPRVTPTTLLRVPIAHNRLQLLHPRAKSSPSTMAAGVSGDVAMHSSVRLLSRGVMKRRASISCVDLYGVAARERQARALKCGVKCG